MNINQMVVNELKEQNLKISTAESITGGKLISSLIEIPGASKITEQSYIVYSDQAKESVLGIDPSLISSFGVVSEEVALEMARETKKLTASDIVISTTGEAGPNTKEQGIEVGTVCFGLIVKEKEFTYKKNFAGDRLGIINNAVTFILSELYYKLK
ncbi:MAG: CinA family protein [Bacilli bacterium]|nr:CinA family protein [Bacilli bacterium]MBN2876920.1 CinA family protein [Bacilli bacterium]